MNPFQWIIVGSVVAGGIGSVDVARPTAHPSFGSMGFKGGPNDIEERDVCVGLVTVPQFDPSKCKTTPAVPTPQPSLAVLKDADLKSKPVAGNVGTWLIGTLAQDPPA
jgi:hypothetical protein